MTELLASRSYSIFSGTYFLLRQIGCVDISLILTQNNAVAGMGSVITGLLVRFGVHSVALLIVGWDREDTLGKSLDVQDVFHCCLDVIPVVAINI